MTNNDGSKEKLSPEEMLNSTEEMLHEEHDSLSFLAASKNLWPIDFGSNLWTKSESDKKGNDDDEADFQIIFDYLPKISWYQAGIVFMTGYSNVAGGSLQLAQESFPIGHSLWLIDGRIRNTNSKTSFRFFCKQILIVKDV